jgi:molecular chaperone DnaK (HSP70)
VGSVTHWGIDLGTSNTTICEDRSGSPHAVNLPDLATVEPLTQTPVVMSCVCVMDDAARTVLVGQEAMTYNWDGQAKGFARGFKRYLGTESQRPMARVAGRTFTAREVATLFLRELIRRLEAQSGEAVTDLTIPTPSGFFEHYRAELQSIVQGIRHRPWWARWWNRVRRRPSGITLRTLDEPVASALGYGVDLARDATLVAFDFGAGSMEAAVVRIRGGTTLVTGRAEVLAKEGLALGGDDVDRWIADKFLPEGLRDWPELSVAVAWEAERVKLLASAGSEATFTFQSRAYGTLDHQGLTALLAEHGLFDEADALLHRLLAGLRATHGLEAADVDEVILEGGSTLLPGVRALVGDVFGRDKVREWLPFESVARGACIFAAGTRVDDFVYHDYALQVRREGGDVEYELLIPAGTRYPTPPDFATRYYASGHDGQRDINLFVCEVGRVGGRPVAWEGRANGSRYFVPRTEGERAFCLCLNEADPALPLNPPGQGTAPRLRVTYTVDASRWLCITVHDLHRKTDLKVAHPVVRLR